MSRVRVTFVIKLVVFEWDVILRLNGRRNAKYVKKNKLLRDDSGFISYDSM
jgi:hypothetical protein